MIFPIDAGVPTLQIIQEHQAANNAKSYNSNDTKNTKIIILLYLLFSSLSQKKEFSKEILKIGKNTYMSYLKFSDPIKAEQKLSKDYMLQSFEEMKILLLSCNSKSDLIKQLENVKQLTENMSLETFSKNFILIREKREHLYNNIYLECQKN